MVLRVLASQKDSKAVSKEGSVVLNLGTGVCEADETVVALVVHDVYIQIFLVNIIAQDQVTPLLYRCLGLCHC